MTECAQLHFTSCRKIRLKLGKKHRYAHAPKSVEAGNERKLTLLWNQRTKTDRPIPNNEVDPIICDNEKETCLVNLLAPEFGI